MIADADSVSVTNVETGHQRSLTRPGRIGTGVDGDRFTVFDGELKIIDART